MKTALVQTLFWDEEEFAELNIDTRLVYLYLLTNPSRGVTNIMKINKRVIAARTGLSLEQIKVCLCQLIEGKYIVEYDCYVSLVKDHVQPKKGRFTEKAIEREMVSIPQDVLDHLSGVQSNELSEARRIQTVRTGIKSESLRKQVFDKYGNYCGHCGAKSKLTIDHIKPVILGGDNKLSNLQVLCSSCNSRKGTSELVPFVPEEHQKPSEHIDIDNNIDIAKDNNMLELVLLSNEKPSRKRDYYWENLIEVYYPEVFRGQSKVSSVERGKLNAAIAILKEINADPSQIKQRALNYKFINPSWAYTCNALATNWNSCSDEQVEEVRTEKERNKMLDEHRSKVRHEEILRREQLEWDMQKEVSDGSK